MIINGNEIKEKIIEELKMLAAEQLTKVCFLQYGHDPAIASFIKVKMRVAEQLGIDATIVQKEANDTAEAIVALGEIIEQEYNGIVVQLPLPSHFDSDLILDSIPTESDIDMLSEDSKAQYRAAKTERTAPVAAAVQEILWAEKIILLGKNIVVLGKGRLVGEPITMLLDRQELPYTVIDIDTPNDVRINALQEADVIISGTGAPHSITPDIIKEGVVLIDAGTSEQKGKLVGDIDPSCADKASLYTPVPGGVGPITVACLFRNLFM
jgi:methylenetetrahydrofolate dehydrogenase (NADP+)/methenyltetrahydrofolate cyclohydrolase